MNVSSVKHNRTPFAASTQMKMFHNYKLEDCTHNTPIWQSEGASSRINMSNSKQVCVPESDTPKNNIIRGSQDSMKGEMRIM